VNSESQAERPDRVSLQRLAALSSAVNLVVETDPNGAAISAGP